MPPGRLKIPKQWVLRTEDGVTVLRVRSPEDAAKLQAHLTTELKVASDAKFKALEAGNAAAFDHAVLQELSVTAVIRALTASGDKSRPEEDGLDSAGWSVVRLKRGFVAETLSVTADEDEVLELAQDVQSLTVLRDGVGEFYDLVDDSLAQKQRALAPIVRDTHAKLEPTLPGNFAMRRVARPVTEYATGFAKQAAEQNKKNRKLVAITTNNVLSSLKDVMGGATPTPPGTPAAPTAGTQPTVGTPPAPPTGHFTRPR